MDELQQHPYESPPESIGGKKKGQNRAVLTLHILSASQKLRRKMLRVSTVSR